MCSRSFRSSAPRGSSSSSSVGSSTRLRAMATRWRCPPDSSSTRLSAALPNPTRSSMALLRFTLSARLTPRRASPNATFSPTDIIGNRASCWNTMFTGRRFGATPRMLLPPMAISPPSGAMNPGDHPQQRRLAAAGGTENGKETAAFDRERQGIHRYVIGEPLDHGVRHQIWRAQLAAFTRSSTRPSISSRPGGMAGYQ